MATEAFTQAKASVNTEREIDVAATLALPDEALALTGLSPEGISQFREALQNLVAVEEQQTKQMTLDLVPPAAETTAPINSGATNGRKTNTPSSKRSPPPARRTNPSTVAPSPEPTGATSTIATEATDSTALATIAAATDPATGAITDIAAVNSAVAPLAEQAPVGATTTNKGKKGANSSRSNKVVATPSAVSIGTSPSPSGQADQASIPQQQVQPTPARTGTANGLLKQPSAKLNKQAAQAQRQAQAEDAWGEFAPEGAPAFNELSKTHQEMWEQRNTFNEEKLNQPNLKKEDQPNYAGDVADILRLHRNDSVASKAKSASIDNKIDDEISALPADQQDAVFKAAEIAQLDTDQYVRGVFDESLKTSKKNAISNAVNQAVGVTSNVLSSALKKLISALSAVALSVSLYFASPITDATAQQRAPAVVATFVANQKLTPDANVVAAWVQQAKDHSGRNYVIADKKAGVLYVMNSKGGVLATAPALYGMNKGDSLEVGRTPAGRFMLQNTELVNEGYGGDIQVFVRDGPSVMAIHRVWLGRPSESREARLASATPNDNRITAGCINAPAEFYNKHLRDLDQSRLYVIPETERVDTWVEKLRQENKSDPSPVPAQGALFAGLLALRRMRKLGLRTAVGTREGVPQNYNEVKEFLSTSESPQRPRLVRSTDSFVEQLVDSHTPFFRWLDRDINHPLWMALKLSKSRQTIIHDDIAKSIDLILSKTVKAAAKSVGVSTADMLKAGGYYAVLRYVNTGGNQEILTRKQDQLSYLRAEYLAAASFAQSTGTPEALVQRNKAGDAVRVQQEAITHFQQRVGINRQNVTDKKDEFLGGYTDKEAADLTIEAEKKWGAANLASVADAIVKLQNYWRQEGITKGVFFPDEVAKWTQNPNYVPTSGVPERDLSEGDTHGYGLFGKSEKDYAREGRETPSDDAYLAVVQQALSVGNRIAHAPFAAQLKEMADNKEMGLGYYGNQGDNSQLYTVKEHDAVNNVTRQRSINFPKEASLAYEAMRGANQEYSDNAVLKAVGMYTKAHGLMVTYLNPMFAPIASIKDLGERAHTLLVRPLTGSGLALNRVKFVADMTKYYPQGILAGWKFALGKPDTSPAGMALKELAMVGGLSLRGRSVARDHMSFARHANIQGLGLTEAAQWMRNYADAFEVLAPLAAYRAVMEQNPGKMSTAGFRVLSAMNFNDKGTKTSKISPLYMFFNPAMQGARATVKNLSTKQGVAFFVAKVTASYALYVLAQALSDDDEELGNSVANLPEYTVSRNVPLVFGDKVIKVPVPFGIDMIAWNTAVALHKLFTGAYDLSTAAGAIALAALDQTSPVLPATEASFHKNTMFWLSKTMAPHFTQIAVNLGASKNDFGGDLYTKYVNPNQPKSMQSKPSTNSGWDDLAQTVAKAGGPDWHPETFRETIKTVIVGPMFSLARAAIEHDDGTSNEMDANRATMDVLGLSRVVGTDRGRAARVYYARAEDTQELMKKATTQNGLPPQEKRGAPLVETTKWLAETQLSGSEQERVLLYLKTDKELKAVTGETPGEAEAAKDKISRAFISKYDALKKGQ